MTLQLIVECDDPAFEERIADEYRLKSLYIGYTFWDNTEIKSHRLKVIDMRNGKEKVML